MQLGVYVLGQQVATLEFCRASLEQVGDFKSVLS